MLHFYEKNKFSVDQAHITITWAYKHNKEQMCNNE